MLHSLYLHLLPAISSSVYLYFIPTSETDTNLAQCMEFPYTPESSIWLHKAGLPLPRSGLHAPYWRPPATEIPPAFPPEALAQVITTSCLLWLYRELHLNYRQAVMRHACGHAMVHWATAFQCQTDRRLLCLEFPGLKTGFLLRPAGMQADGEVGLGLGILSRSGELGSERAEVPD